MQTLPADVKGDRYISFFNVENTKMCHFFINYFTMFPRKLKVLRGLKRSGRQVGLISAKLGSNLTDWYRVMTKNIRVGNSPAVGITNTATVIPTMKTNKL